VTTRGRAVIGGLLGLYLMSVGALGGVLVERLRFDRARTDILVRHDRALREWQAFLMALDRGGAAKPTIEAEP